MTLPTWLVLLMIVPAFVTAPWYLRHAWKISRYECFALCATIAYGMTLEVAAIRTTEAYDYANLWVMFGSSPNWVPWAIGVCWAILTYICMRTSDAIGLPWWQRPLTDGAMATTIDFMLDPVLSNSHWVSDPGVSCMHDANPAFGGMGVWTWCVPNGSTGLWYNVPMANFLGWFYVITFISLFIRLGRRYLGADSRGWLAQLGLAIGAALLAFGACYVAGTLLSANRIGVTGEWIVVGALFAVVIAGIIVQRRQLKFSNRLQPAVYMWPVTVYVACPVLFFAKRIDESSWPMSALVMLVVIATGILGLLLPSIGAFRSASRRGAA
jgi:hypothetical protein